MRYGLILPYPFSGLEMPPDVKRYYLLGGKERAEPEKDNEKKQKNFFVFIPHNSDPHPKVIPPELKNH